jgi:hypothetical protein
VREHDALRNGESKALLGRPGRAGEQEQRHEPEYIAELLFYSR